MLNLDFSVISEADRIFANELWVLRGSSSSAQKRSRRFTDEEQLDGSDPKAQSDK